ncbi:MAG TPA: TIGR03000 domain-containing protein, partial [Pirellulales bacterium]|nr:TIGR03000 domain-containing protein [Pirellulales bacterium]
MSRTAINLVMAIAVLGFIAEGASAFGHRCGGWGRGYCGYGYGGCGYGGCGYGGWGYGGMGYGGWTGWGGWGYGGYYGQMNRATARPLVQAARPAVEANTAMLTVDVPRDAQIFVNDRLTTSTGEHREYVSRNLKTDAQYTYKVRAEFT